MLSIQKITGFVNDCVTFRQKTTFCATSSGLFSTRAQVRPSGRISPAAVSAILFSVGPASIWLCGNRTKPQAVPIPPYKKIQWLRAKGKNEKGKRSAARKNAYTSSILSAQIKSNRNMETRQRAPVGHTKEIPSVIAARCHLPHGGRLWREGEVFHSAKGSLFEGAGTA